MGKRRAGMPGRTSPEHHARLEGAAAGGREEGPAPSGDTPRCQGCGRCGAARGWQGAGLGHRGVGVSRRLLPPFSCHPLHPLRPTGATPGSCPHLATAAQAEGEELLRDRDAGGEEAGKRGPLVRCTPTGTTAMAGQSLTRSSRVPAPCGVPVPVEPSRAPRCWTA